MNSSIFFLIILFSITFTIQFLFILDFYKKNKNLSKKNINLKNHNEKNLIILKNLAENLIDGIVIFDKNGFFNFFNSSFLKIWNLNQDFFQSNKKIHYIDFINKIINENKISPKNIDSFRNWHIGLFKSLQNLYNEFLHLNDGRTIRMLIIPNNFDEIIFLYQDITDRLKIRMELNLLEILFENSLDLFEKPILIFSQNFKIHFYNQHVKSFLKNDIFNDIEQKNLYIFFSNFINTPNNLNLIFNQIYEFKQNNKKIHFDDLFLDINENKINIRLLKINDFIVIIFEISPVLIKNLFKKLNEENYID